MIATRALRLGAVLTLALAASLGTSNLAKAQATKAEAKAKGKMAEKAKAKAAELVDLNTATSAELQTLPGVGEATARKIIDSRPHKAVADLAGAGVSASEIEKLKPLVEVKALPAPVDVNGETLEKLETLPGIGPALAREIVAARPHAGYESIAKLKGIGPEKLDALKGRLKFGEAPAVAKAKAKVEEKAKAKVEEAKKDELSKAKMEEKAKKVAEKAKGKVDEAKAEEKVAAKVSKLPPGTKININTASKEELDRLFDIGDVKAQAIIDYRNEKKFEKIEDIMQVKGIKEGIFAKIKDNITVK
jgi:competence protein ComEA